MAVLPIIIFSYISAAILSFEHKAPVLIICILALVILSNGIASFVSYGVGMLVIPLITLGGHMHLSTLSQEMTPYYSLGLPQIVSADKAMILGIMFGIFFSFVRVPIAIQLTKFLQKYVTIALQKGFVSLLPIYVLGFVLRMQYEGTLRLLIQNYGQVFGLVFMVLVMYIGLMYMVASQFHLPQFIQNLRQMLPAGLTGFSTISSAVTMPFTLAATEKNIKNTQFAHLVVPTTVNIHMIGHGISIPIISLALLSLSGHPLPSLGNYALFVAYFCIAKFSATAIPGGGIIVILPILQSQLGFTPEMASLMIMLDILQDPILTSGNVMGNGAFAIFCYRFCSRIKFIRLAPNTVPSTVT
jgi:Na+/H+-dicarboxylate symporter